MRRDLQKTRERQTTSLLLKTFMLLAMIVTGSNAWGQTSLGKVEIGSDIEANNEGWQKFGSNGIIKEAWIFGTAEIKNPAGYYAKITDKGKIKLRFTPGDLHAGDIIKVSVGPSGESSTNLGYFVEGSNTFVGAGEGTYTMAQDVNYTLRTSDIQDDPDSDYDMIVINRSGGGYAYAYHSFEIVRPEGHTVTFSGLYGGGSVTAKRNDINSDILSGWTVPDGTKVTFTPVPSGDNLPWKWNIDGTEKYSQDPQTVTIDKDIIVQHQFGSVYVNVYTNNAELGTVNIKHGDTNATTFHVTPWAGDFTMTATPVGHGMFEGWYEDADHTRKLDGKGLSFDVHNPEGTNNYFAYFKEGKIVDVNVEPAGLNPDITIYQHGHHEGCSAGNNGDWGTLANHKPMGQHTNIDVTVGDVDGYTFDGWYINGVKQETAPQADYNYGNVANDLVLVAKFKKNLHPDVNCANATIDLTKVEPYGHTTFNSTTGEFVVSDYNKYGNGLIIEFNNPQNMSHVKTVTINGADFDNPYFNDKDDNSHWPAHNIGGNKTVININSNASYNEIVKIDLRDVPAGTYTISSIVLEYDHKPTIPQFINGTAAEMTIYESDDVVLSVDNALNTYWREYQDENYRWNEQVYTRIAADEWNTPIRTITGLTAAGSPYYFAAERGNNCEFSKWHVSDKNTVKVIVLPAPTNLTVTYDTNGGTGTAPVDNNTYSYKGEATILGPGSIAKEGYYFGYWSKTPDGSGERYSNVSDNGNTKITLTENTTLYAIWNKVGFKGYFNYENRLMAQWNFDLCDGARFNEASAAGDTWTSSGKVTQPDGTTKTTYTLKKAISNAQLVYGGSNNDVVIPIAAGLKFTADANQIKIVVSKRGSEIINTQLVLAKDVQMEVPYVRNSYRDDSGVDESAYDWKDTDTDSWPDENKFRDEEGEIKTGYQTYWNQFKPERFKNFQDCLHHINRDIVYIVCKPTVWTGWQKEGGAITNKCHDDSEKALFNNGGDEDVHGLRYGEKKVWEKLNFTGNQGSPCIITFAKETTIDRIGVNRNLVYSYYTENIAATSKNQYTKPVPGLRIIGSPRGAKVADVGDTYATYTNAIAMTYGGWPYNGSTYQDVAGASKTDSWGNLTVYHGEGLGEGNNIYDDTQFTSIDVKKVPVATDGFPVYSSQLNHAYNENVNPAATKYHDKYNGNFLLHQDDGGDVNYLVNYNPWTLPCRGAYVKFEPTLPGVLNVHILQEAGSVYYIADEYGRLVKDNIFVKAGTANTVFDSEKFEKGHFSINQKDNVKYSFDVYPGKTYYLFSNVAGMGVTGFNFEPYVYRKYATLTAAGGNKEDYELARQDVGLKTAVMEAGPVFTFNTAETFDYTNQSAQYSGGTQTNRVETDGSQVMKDDGVTPKTEDYAAIDKTSISSYPNKTNNVNPLKYDNKAVHVTLDRSFTAGKWQTIVLPYSMNNLQLETVFGEGTKVVTLRDVQLLDPNNNGQTTAYFIYHMNQDILAGYPYLIYPTQNVSKVETNAYLDNTVKGSTGITGYMADIDGSWVAPANVEISGLGQNTVTYYADNVPENPTVNNTGANYDGMSVYAFKSTYRNDTSMPKGSYVMSNNQLTRLPQAQTSGAFKAFLNYSGEAYFAKEYMITATSLGELEDELGGIDGIENILLESGIVGAKTDIYNINGQMVRQHTDDLNGLPKGMYIVNGKKFIVK